MNVDALARATPTKAGRFHPVTIADPPA